MSTQHNGGNNTMSKAFGDMVRKAQQEPERTDYLDIIRRATEQRDLVAWIPQKGDAFTGRYIRREWLPCPMGWDCSDSGGVFEVLVAESHTGTLTRITLGSSLREHLDRAFTLKEGDPIAVVFHGEVETKSGRPYKQFGFAYGAGGI